MIGSGNYNNTEKGAINNNTTSPTPLWLLIYKCIMIKTTVHAKKMTIHVVDGIILSVSAKL